MRGVDKVEGVDCTSEQVDLLVWVPHDQFGGVLMEEYVKHCRIHVLALIYQQNLVIRDLLKAWSPQLPHFQVAVMWNSDPGIVLVLYSSPHLDRILEDRSSCVFTQHLLSLSYPPDSGYLVKFKLKIKT